jgi:hypothetical protein
MYTLVASFIHLDLVIETFKTAGVERMIIVIDKSISTFMERLANSLMAE